MIISSESNRKDKRVDLLAIKLVGRRVRLIHTEDPYTSLRSGDTGTITDVCELPFEDTPIQLWISWDSGVKLCLLEGIDRYDLLDP